MPVVMVAVNGKPIAPGLFVLRFTVVFCETGASTVIVMVNVTWSPEPGVGASISFVLGVAMMGMVPLSLRRLISDMPLVLIIGTVPVSDVNDGAPNALMIGTVPVSDARALCGT